MSLMENRLTSFLVRQVIFRHPRLMLFLTKLSAPDEEADIQIAGAPLRVHKLQERSYWRAYRRIHETYLEELLELIISLATIVEPGDTFIDAGANVGMYSSTLSRLGYLFPTMRFYAIEPHPEAARRLRESVRGRNVTVLNLALADRKGRLQFREGTSTLTFSAVGGANDFTLPGTGTMVEASRLDDLDIVGDSIVLKLSVRGYEREVLVGASNLMASGRVKAIAVYCEPGDRDLPAELERQGYALFDARTLEPGKAEQMLAVRREWLRSAANGSMPADDT